MGLFSTFFKQLLLIKEKMKNNKQLSEKDVNIDKLGEITNIKQSLSSCQKESSVILSNPSSNNHSSSGKDYKYEGGRRYHGYDDVAYILPNDDDEADRIHEQHWILKYALRCNYHAPVTKMLEEGITVLDSGTGPATWIFEMGEAYPNSKFYGVDISCTFPETIMPKNVHFTIANVAKHIPFPDNTFDYIHQRLLMLGLTDENWHSTLKELFRVLKPGGYLELAETDLHDFVNMGPAWEKLQGATANMIRSRGIPVKVAHQLESRSINAGFVNQVVEVIPLAINHSGKAGDLLWGDFKHGYENLKPAFVKNHPEWEDDQAYKDYIESCGAEAKKNKMYMNWYACCCQKPV